jgi:hypothetical protein
LLSAGTGAWPPAGLWLVRPAGAVPVAPAGPAPPAAAVADGADDPEPPQAPSAVTSPARATALPSHRGLSGRLLVGMPRFYRKTDEEKMNPPGAGA